MGVRKLIGPNVFIQKHCTYIANDFQKWRSIGTQIDVDISTYAYFNLRKYHKDETLHDWFIRDWGNEQLTCRLFDAGSVFSHESPRYANTMLSERLFVSWIVRSSFLLDCNQVLAWLLNSHVHFQGVHPHHSSENNALKAAKLGWGGSASWLELCSIRPSIFCFASSL